MAETDTPRGLTRRDMIRASAVAGAAAWTAPVIVDSLSSPAAAGSAGITCSWFFVIFQKPASEGGGIFFTGAEQSSGSVCTDHANSNVSGCKTCGGVQYGMVNNDFFSGACTSSGGTPVPDVGNTCVNYIEINGNTVSAINGATILASFSHVGSGADCACPTAGANNSVGVCVDGGCTG